MHERVKGLFESRQPLSQKDFAAALGVDPSWVSAFLAGRRFANDIDLLVKIARFFGVTVGYLLNETERGRDAGAASLLAAWEVLSEKDRRAVLTMALMLRGHTDAPAGESDSAPGDEPPKVGGTTRAPKKRR